MKKFAYIWYTAALMASSCAPPVQIPWCDVDAYLQNRATPAFALTECGTFDVSTAHTQRNGMQFWSCIRDAAAAKREFHFRVIHVQSQHNNNGSAEVRVMHWAGGYGAFFLNAQTHRWSSPVPTLYILGQTTDLLYGQPTDSYVLVRDVRADSNIAARTVLSRSFDADRAPGDELPFPPPPVGVWIETHQLSPVPLSVGNEAWCHAAP